MIDIPQDVLNRVVDILQSRIWGDSIFAEAVRELIEAAQLPIAPATDDERVRFAKDSSNSPNYALNQFISRRNSPPKVDPLVEKILAVQYRVRIAAAENGTIGHPDTVLREAEAIAAEVRKFAALDAMGKGTDNAQQ